MHCMRVGSPQYVQAAMLAERLLMPLALPPATPMQELEMHWERGGPELLTGNVYGDGSTFEAQYAVYTRIPYACAIPYLRWQP